MICEESIVNNYPPKGRCIVVDIYRGAKRRGIYLALGTDPEGDSCFSIYQNIWIKMHFISKKQFNVNLFSIFSTRASCQFDFRRKIN